MTSYQIFSLTTGHDFGVFEGATPDEAIAAMAEQAGADVDASDLEVRETETAMARADRLGATVPESISEAVATAHEVGISDDDFIALCLARRFARKTTVVLPQGHLEGLSRGKGWCRKGKGDSAEWGEREGAKGYRVGPGDWVVGHSDGFSRKRQDRWRVRHITVGGETWTVAD
jgi:hypothetical protein